MRWHLINVLSEITMDEELTLGEKKKEENVNLQEERFIPLNEEVGHGMFKKQEWFCFDSWFIKIKWKDNSIN